MNNVNREAVIGYLIEQGYQSAQITKYIEDCKGQGYDENQINVAMYGMLSEENKLKPDTSNYTVATQEQQVVSQEPVKHYNPGTGQTTTNLATVESQPSAQQTQPTPETIVESVTQESGQVVAEAQPQTNEVAQVVNETAPIQNNDVMASIKQQIGLVQSKEALLDLIGDVYTKVNLIKTEQAGPFMNEGHLTAPSYKMLIEPIRNVIVKKRKTTIGSMWFEKYRPEVIEEVLFPNEVIKQTVQGYLDKGEVQGHCMFYGGGGVGKTTLNKVLMNCFVKHKNDMHVLDRKVDDIDKLKGWLKTKPIGKQKFVIAEEFDRLSDAAQTELKNGLLENYPNVIFLASTNKIFKIDEALLSRFTLVAHFSTADQTLLFNKLKFILTNERIQFTDDDIWQFVEKNQANGVRLILNNLQLSCYNGVFDHTRVDKLIGSSGTERDIVNAVVQIINYCVNLPKATLFNLTYNLDFDPNVGNMRKWITETLQANYSLNYDYIFMNLVEENIWLPARNIINAHYQDLELKKIKSLYFESMLNEIMIMQESSKLQ